MKRCPECRRDYYDDTLLYCLDDGSALLEGPRTDEPPTAILPDTQMQSEATTRSLKHSTVFDENPSPVSDDGSAHGSQSRRNVWLSIGLVVLLVGGIFLGYRSTFFRSEKPQTESIKANTSTAAPVLYWQMTETEQQSFARERSAQVFTMIGDDQTELDEEELSAITKEINSYVERKDSLSQKPFEEGLRTIYGRATQYAPMIAKAYNSRQVPSSLGIYQAMIESEYRDCEIRANGVGMFQFSRGTAAKYGLLAKDYCDVQKQAVDAANYMSDLRSDFSGESSSGLGLFAYFGGEDLVRDCLRDLHAHGTTERSFWAIFSHQDQLREPLTKNEKSYVPRFFAAAIIGETPEAFGLSTPQLTTIVEIDKK